MIAIPDLLFLPPTLQHLFAVVSVLTFPVPSTAQPTWYSDTASSLTTSTLPAYLLSNGSSADRPSPLLLKNKLWFHCLKCLAMNRLLRGISDIQVNNQMNQKHPCDMNTPSKVCDSPNTTDFYILKGTVFLYLGFPSHTNRGNPQSTLAGALPNPAKSSLPPPVTRWVSTITSLWRLSL